VNTAQCRSGWGHVLDVSKPECVIGRNTATSRRADSMQEAGPGARAIMTSWKI
jgi:hypothetical protein